MEGFSFKDTDRFLPLKLGPTARDTLQEFIDIDVSAEDLVKILHRNHAYKDLFARFVNQKTQPRKSEEGEKTEGKEPPSPTHRLISLLGMIGSRNLILALRMHKALENRFPVNEEGAVDIKASDYLKHALEMEEVFLRNNLHYSETAYAAAVYYDWMERHLARLPDYKKVLEPYAGTVWKRAQRTGILAYFISHEVRGSAPKQAMAAGFLVHGGKLLLASALKEYVEFETNLDQNEKLPPLARLIQEREKFGLSYEEVSAHSLRYFDVFQSLSAPVSRYREPYCLKGGDGGQYSLAAVLYLADAMARTWRIPNDEKDPAIQEWAHPSVKQLRLSATKLIAIMKSAMTLR